MGSFSLVIVLQILLLGTLSLVLLYQGYFVLIALILDKDLIGYDVSSKFRFAVIVPAHDEEDVIDRCVRSILSTDYAKNCRDVYIIADNCADRTVEIAQLYAVTCLVREDIRKSGKGYAIQWSLDQIGFDKYDAIVLVDADAVVSRNIFVELNKALWQGEKAIQIYNGTLNPKENWLTRMFQLSDVLQYCLYFKGREILGLTCRLIGNGMCLSREVLKAVPWSAFSITENWEYYHKVLLAGYRVAFVQSAFANSDQVSSFKEGRKQRMRWHAGWFESVKRFVPLLIKNSFKRKDWRLVDAAFDFLLPSPSSQAFMIGASVLVVCSSGENVMYWWMGINVFLGAITGGVVLGVAGARYRDYVALLVSPAYIIWKVAVRVWGIFTGKPGSWVRTNRRRVV